MLWMFVADAAFGEDPEPQPIENLDDGFEDPLAALDVPAEPVSDELPIDLGFGLFFNAGGSFMDQPDDRSTDDGIQVPFNGFAGFSPGAGLSIEFGVYEAVSLELDLIRNRDHAQSKFILDEIESPFSATQMAWHVPLLLEVSVPKGPVRPNFFVGREFVFPGEPTITQPGNLATELRAHSENYGHWAVGIGLEFPLPVEEVDLRIPLDIRGSWDPSWPNRAVEIADYTLGDTSVMAIDYRTRWQFHAGIGLGIKAFVL